MARGRGRWRQPPALERRYGFFRCKSCQRYWESAHVQCIKNTRKVFFKQDCGKCGRACNPFKVEAIMCPNCGFPANECRGSCGDDYNENDDPYDKHHINFKKPHRADLCHACKSGRKCVWK